MRISEENKKKIRAGYRKAAKPRAYITRVCEKYGLRRETVRKIIGLRTRDPMLEEAEGKPTVRAGRMTNGHGAARAAGCMGKRCLRGTPPALWGHPPRKRGRQGAQARACVYDQAEREAAGVWRGGGAGNPG